MATVITHYTTNDGRFTLCGIQVTRLWSPTKQIERHPDMTATCNHCIAREAVCWECTVIATEKRL